MMLNRYCSKIEHLARRIIWCVALREKGRYDSVSADGFVASRTWPGTKRRTVIRGPRPAADPDLQQN
jgi:hypothetical protein